MNIVFPKGDQKRSGNPRSLAERTPLVEGLLWTQTPILHTSLYSHLAGMEGLLLHQIPKEAGAAELAAKAGVGACNKPKGSLSVPVPSTQDRNQGGRTGPILEAARKPAATSS